VRRSVVSSNVSDSVSVGARVWDARAVDNVVGAEASVSSELEVGVGEVELDENSSVDNVAKGDGVINWVTTDVLLNTLVVLVLPEIGNWTL